MKKCDGCRCELDERCLTGEKASGLEMVLVWVAIIALCSLFWVLVGASVAGAVW